MGAPVAQLDRASGFEPEGREFESLRARQIFFLDSFQQIPQASSRLRPTQFSRYARSDDGQFRLSGFFLLELLFELRELLPQVHDFFLKIGDVIAKCSDVLLQKRDAFPIGGVRIYDCLYFWLWLAGLDVAGEEMRVAGLFGARLTRKNFDERGLALHQVLQTGLHSAQVVEGMHAFGASAQLAGRLRATQQQDAENGDLVTIEIEGFLETVFVLGHAAVRSADGADQGFSLQ